MAVSSPIVPTPVASTRTVPWVALLWFGALLIAIYAVMVQRMVWEWLNLEEMGHGLFVPFVAAYIAWQKQDRILAAPIKPNYWLGIPLMLWGFTQFVLGIFGSDFFLERTALIVSLIGVIVTCCGLAVLRQLTFPLLILLFMIRLPLFIYSQITLPLQMLASRVAEVSLSLLGIPVVRDGNILELASQRLSVVEACSGIRSLISLSFLALVYAYFFDPKPWMRWVLLLTSIPIAIGANAARVTLTGVISEYKQEFAAGAYHTFEGWVMFVVALVLLIIAHQIINRIYNMVHAEKQHV